MNVQMLVVLSMMAVVEDAHALVGNLLTVAALEQTLQAFLKKISDV